MLFDDDRPKPKPAHEIGCDLTLLSANELSQRIELLKSEINRLDAEMAAKTASRGAAESFFKPK